MTALLFVGGLAALVLGAELLVGGASSLAKRLGVSPLVIGLTLVGFGTSTPELVTSVQAALAGSPGIAVGNVVGSNTANVLLIVGLTAWLRPLSATPAAFRRDGAVLSIVSLLCLWIVLSGTMGRGIGAAFAGALLAYLGATYLLERRKGGPSATLHEAEAAAAHATSGGTPLALATVLGGLSLTIVGSRFFVEGAIQAAQRFGVSESVMGLSAVAIGTSLPELATSMSAARRGQGDVAIGNVVGSNIFNVLGILGVTSLVKPLVVPPEIARVDIWVMLASTALLLAILAGLRISRAGGGLSVLAYLAYVSYLATGAGWTASS